jgi:hypothetical protein
MNILEKDLFDYVFFPDILSKEKYNSIEESKSKFRNELNLLWEIKENLKGKISDGIIERIMLKLNEYNKRRLIVLEKANNPHLFQSGQLVLAAESPVLEQKLRTDTYEDKNSEYMVKIITDQQQNKIFIFNKDNSEMRNVKINIEPSGKSFILESSFKPYVLTPKQEINRISIYPSE